MYKSASKRKQREYGERISRVEDGSFTAMIFATTGGMSPRMHAALGYLAAAKAAKTAQHLSVVMSVIRIRFAFAIARSALMCLKGSRTIWRPKVSVFASSDNVVLERASLLD